MKVLVAEDNQITRKIIDLHLTKHGYETVICKNGQDAIEALKDNEDVDLILSDLQMPEMSGMDLLNAVKNNARTSKIPFVIISAFHEREVVLSTIEHGCSDFIAKPINVGVLMEKVNRIFGKDKPVAPPSNYGTHYVVGLDN